MNKIKHRLLLVVLSLIVSLPLYAEALQSLDKIEQAAYFFGVTEAQAQYDNPQIVLEPLDTRLRLQACESELEVFSNTRNTGLGNQTVGVKCYAPVAWTVYVPIKIKVFKPVVVAAKLLTAKQLITKSDIRIEQQDIATLRQGYIEKTDIIIGQQLKYPIAMGSVINPSSLMNQKVIRRGEQVMMIAEVGEMEVRMAGKAMSDGEQGQRVRVKNTSSKRIVEGIVDAPGIVRVTM